MTTTVAMAVAMAVAKRIFRIQYVSNLHLERYEKATFPLLVKPCARYLALAGDIGKPGNIVFESFLQYVSHNWDKVFYVAGTTELSYSENKAHRDILTSTNRYPNIHYLHNSRPAIVTKENVAVVGATLWPWQKKMLEDQVYYRTTQKQPICMLTYHMPSPILLSSRFLNKNHNVVNCENLMVPQVKAWIYGKPHNASTGVLNSTFTAVNARGYPTEYVPGFSPTAFLEFSVEGEETYIDSELARSVCDTPDL